MSVDEAIKDALKQVLSEDGGSGASVDDPRRLGRIHPLLAPTMEHVLISGIYGDKDKDWFDAGRRYHKNKTVCEQLIRVGRSPKPDWAAPDQIYSMFFEISELTDSAPVPDELRKAAAEAAVQMRVPDVSFFSRFPLTVIKARDAKEAARTIAGYLAQAQAEGWRIGSARALVDDWRNEYELTKGEEQTVMRFDMRPMLTSPSRLDLVALTLIAGTSKLDEVIRNFDSMGSWPEAFAAAGLSFVDTSERKTQSVGLPTSKEQTAPDIFYDLRNRTICWNEEALKKLMRIKVQLMGKASTLEMLASDIEYLLVLARSDEWKGAEQLFRRVPNGFTSTLQDGQSLDDCDALGLSRVLSKISRVVQDRSNPALKVAESLAEFAATGGFTIRYEQSVSPHPMQAVRSTVADAPSRSLTSSAPVEQTAVAGPPGGVARYRQHFRPFNLRDRINMLNGFYGCVGSWTVLLKEPDYINAAARESVDVSPKTMGFVTNSKQLYLNADQVQTVSKLTYAYIRHPTVTTLHGPTFSDALCYGFYRLVCMFVGKDEFPIEDDVIQHARDLKKWEWDAMLKVPANRRHQLVLQRIKTTLQFMKELGEGTPLESAVAKAQKKLRWRFAD
jgi:hypothetical protein